MDMNDPLFSLYKELYFHEIEMREKLNARLQVPLLIIISFFGIIAFMIQKIDINMSGDASIVFYIFIGLSIAALGVSVFLFVRSWIGYTYKFMPSAEKSEEYRDELDKLYHDYEGGDQLTENYFTNYIRNEFIKCSTTNTVWNDKRSLFMHRTNSSLIVVMILVLISFMVFFFGNLDKNNATQTVAIKIVKPVEIKGVDNGK